MTVDIDTGAAQAALQSFGNLRGRLTSAVRNTLAAGKAEAKSRIEARYTAKAPLSLGKVSLRASGLNGTLSFGGKRNELKRFILNPSTRPPHNPPGGLNVQVVKGSGGVLPHAFIGRGTVFERTGQSRLPIRHISTIALSGMAKAVSEHVLNKMENKLRTEINNALGG